MGAPDMIAYCHCDDCRRLSGAPVAAFAAFATEALAVDPPLGAGVSHTPGVRRWFCTKCGTQIGASYAYLPGQIYVPVGVFDQVADLAPELHAHAGSQVPWLSIDDDLPRYMESSRDALQTPSSAVDPDAST